MSCGKYISIWPHLFDTNYNLWASLDTAGFFKSRGILEPLCDVGKVTSPLWSSVLSVLRIGFWLIPLSAVNVCNSWLNFIHNHPNMPTLADRKFKRPGPPWRGVKYGGLTYTGGVLWEWEKLTMCYAKVHSGTMGANKNRISRNVCSVLTSINQRHWYLRRWF